MHSVGARAVPTFTRQNMDVHRSSLHADRSVTGALAERPDPTAFRGLHHMLDEEVVLGARATIKVAETLPTAIVHLTPPASPHTFLAPFDGTHRV